ncbi:MAG: hypothetical protein LAO06_10510 [Acidobacteriia bacterium]|nr:hypothetical protein [Terriglobia bacterium]
MKCVVGVFASRLAAEGALGTLRSSGISERRLSFLTPEAAELTAVPITDTEGSGVGMAIGAVVGGAIGLGGGFWVGVLAGSVLAPATDSLSVGLASGLVLGIAGALGGFVGGGAWEENWSEGLPRDELLLYEDALRQGRSVVIAAAKGSAEANFFRWLLAANGAESVDLASHTWWVGLRNRGYAGGGMGSGRKRGTMHDEFEIALDLLKTPPSSGPRKAS